MVSDKDHFSGFNIPKIREESEETEFKRVTMLKHSLKFCVYHVTHVKPIGCVLSLGILGQNLLLCPA